MEKSNNPSLDLNQTKFYEINIKHLLNRIIRNKSLIGSITFFSVLFAIIIQFNIKKTWEGQFQIVLSENRNSLSTQNFSPEIDRLSLLNNLKNYSSSLNTEVGILESPSVLMPIFDYVKNAYSKNESKKNELLFFDWKKKINISLKKKTSILDISYRDKNKELIIPVLNKMSKAFQEYSFRNKLRSNQIAKNYINDQIKIYKEKSATSIKKAEQFAIENDLYIYEKSLIDTQDLTSQKGQLAPYQISNALIETLRVNSANEIRFLNEQIKKIGEMEDEQNFIKYIVSNISSFESKDYSPLKKDIDIINALENEIEEGKTIYKDNDKYIENLKRKRNSLLYLVKERSLGILKAKKLSAESYMISAMRPEGILLKYKELMRESERDERTLINLENQARIILLEEAKNQDPWELITTPTLLDEYINPGLSTYVFLGYIRRHCSGNILFDLQRTKI